MHKKHMDSLLTSYIDSKIFFFFPFQVLVHILTSYLRNKTQLDMN